MLLTTGMFRLVCLLIGYAFGCIQSAFIVGKVTKNLDVREHGSGNAGTSNVIRVIGKRAGIAVFVIDVLKAIAAYMVCALLFNGSGSFIDGGYNGILPGLYAGFGVVLGHNFPFFLKFKGGKGIASMLGVMLALDWRAALPTYAIGFIILMATRYMSLTSLSMTLLFLPLLLFFNHRPETLLVAVVMAAMAFFLHRGNIQRLWSGTERKLALSSKK